MFEKNRNTLLTLLEAAPGQETPLVYASPGSGLSALSAVRGGINVLFALNSGVYRMAGVPPQAALLPFGNANNQVETLIASQILPRCPDTPVVAGVYASDPTIPIKERFARLKQLGVAGIINWPPVTISEGPLMNELRKRGVSEKGEADMLRAARDYGFITFGFSCTDDNSRSLAHADVDVIVINVGWTLQEITSMDQRDRIQYAILQINQRIEAVREERPDNEPVYLYYGSNISNPHDTKLLYQQTGVAGFGAGSPLEQIPMQSYLEGLYREFTGINKKRLTQQNIDEPPPQFVGSSQPMLRLYRSLRRVARYAVGVCIEGESGSGKELAASMIHSLSPRHTRPFITVNCGAIPDSLVESELFGHERGAFTGASERRIGKFELADRGTLFLDEVAELSPKAQVCLLRAIQQKEIVRVGGKKNIPVDVRIITATNCCLREQVAQGKFRADLFYRLNTTTLRMPPLRERLEDMGSLVRHILERCREDFGCAAQELTPQFLQHLTLHSWPGNVRELQQVLTEAAIMEENPVLQGYAFAPDNAIPPLTPEAHETSELHVAREVPLLPAVPVPHSGSPENRRVLAQNALELAGGNKARAARQLGVSRKTLYCWLQ